jgi:DNA-directed RNA polymerase beta subunit
VCLKSKVKNYIVLSDPYTRLKRRQDVLSRTIPHMTRKIEWYLAMNGAERVVVSITQISWSVFSWSIIPWKCKIVFLPE